MEPDDKTITITSMDGATDTITIDMSDTDFASAGTITINSDYTYTLDDITVGTVDLDWLNDNRITLEPTMWEDCMPDPQKLKKMCEQYPALEKVYENFKTVYSMVEQDWKGNHEDDESIF